MAMFNDVIWVGNQELIIVCDGGTCVVRDLWENYNIVFRGSYENCYAYCKQLERAYLESLI